MHRRHRRDRAIAPGLPTEAGRCERASSASASRRFSLLLSDGPTHGYELLERLPSLIGEERVDVGNVYRALRALEEEGLVVSEWEAELPGPAKRTYTLTEDGSRPLLARWRESLGRAPRRPDRLSRRSGREVNACAKDTDIDVTSTAAGRGGAEP